MYEQLDPHTIYILPGDHFAWIFDHCLDHKELTPSAYLIQLEQGVFVATPDGMSSNYLLVPAPIAAQLKNLSNPCREPYVSEEEAMAILDQAAPNLMAQVAL